MQTLLGHSAVWRGMLLFAGMLWGKTGLDKTRTDQAQPSRCGALVSWCSDARSRREDEMARSSGTEPTPTLAQEGQGLAVAVELNSAGGRESLAATGADAQRHGFGNLDTIDGR
jgi:hypothetical protein